MGRWQAIFSQESWRISRKNCAVQGAKNPPVGHVDMFQASPSLGGRAAGSKPAGWRTSVWQGRGSAAGRNWRRGTACSSASSSCWRTAWSIPSAAWCSGWRAGRRKASRLLRLQLLRPEERPGGPPLPGPLCLAVQSHQPEGPAALTPEQTEWRPSLYLSLSGAERGAAVFYL